MTKAEQAADIYGYEVSYERSVGCAGREVITTDRPGTLSKVKRWAIMQPLARRVLECKPITKEQWVRAHGFGYEKWG